MAPTRVRGRGGFGARIARFLAAVVLLALPSAARAADAVLSATLDNGLRALLLEDHRSPVVSAKNQIEAEFVFAQDSVHRRAHQLAQFELIGSYTLRKRLGASPIGSFPLRLDTTPRVAGFVIGIEARGLGLDYADRYWREVARVTAADIQRVSLRFLGPDGFSRVLVGQSP